MKMIIVKVLVVLVAVISTACVVALFTKKDYTISREIIISAPGNTVFDFVRYNKNQKLYSLWLSFDPATKIKLSGAEDGTSGAILYFESNNRKTGTGEWEIKQIEPGKRVDFQLRFIAPFKFIADGSFIVETISADKTRLKWVYNSGMNWPMNFMLIFMDMDKIVGNDISASMTNIKTIIEKRWSDS
jgi:hypothetical protein